MTIDDPIQKPTTLMTGMPPGKYCGVVDLREGNCIQIGSVSVELFAPSIRAVEEFVHIALAAWPDRPAGFVNIWVEVVVPDGS